MPKNGTQHQKMPNSHGGNRDRTPLEAKKMGENGMEQQTPKESQRCAACGEMTAVRRTDKWLKLLCDEYRTDAGLCMECHNKYARIISQKAINAIISALRYISY